MSRRDGRCLRAPRDSRRIAVGTCRRNPGDARRNAGVYPIDPGQRHAARRSWRPGAASRPLPSSRCRRGLRAAFRISRATYTGDNVLALLPHDPSVGKEIVVVSASPRWATARRSRSTAMIYTTAPSIDAAYVATLIRLAEQRTRPAASIAACYSRRFNRGGEGLLGAVPFFFYPTPDGRRAADLSRTSSRQLRRCSLEILTMHAVDARPWAPRLDSFRAACASKSDGI